LHILWLFIMSGDLGGKPPAAGGKEVWRWSLSAWRVLGIYYQIKPFLGRFQLKFCLKTFETCSLLYITVLK